MNSAELPGAPAGVADEAGAPRFGTYQGVIPEVDLKQLSGRWQLGQPQRALKHKRWLYCFMATPEVAAYFAVSDLTYTSNAFALVVDLRDNKVLVDRGFLGLPGPLVKVSDKPGEGLEVSFLGPGGRLAASRPAGDARYHVAVDLMRLLPYPKRELSWKGELLAVGGPPALTVVAPVAEDGVVNVTQKWAGLLSFGKLEAAGRSFDLDGGVGGMDYTHGYLARHTAWRWAFACGRLADGTPLGLNLVEGFNEGDSTANENALWLGRELFPLPRVHFDFNKADVLDEWKVRTSDGSVDLAFRPIGAHREERDLKLVKSHFVQPVGTWKGTVTVGGRKVAFSGVPGVTEDQDILW
ncbi:MAG: DUF2804 domain-containing protein [Myxococcaceae bacterium]